MEEVTTYTPLDLKHIRELLRLIVEVPGMMHLDPSRARVVLDALDARDALLRELVEKSDSFYSCRYCLKADPHKHENDCLITRVRALWAG